MNGKGEVIELEEALAHHQLTHEQFISMCVAAGCDYLKNIKTIGIHKAKQLVKKDNFPDELQKHKFAPANYREAFLQARSVFQHQLIYHVGAKRVQPLLEWEESDKMLTNLICGQYPFTAFLFNSILQTGYPIMVYNYMLLTLIL